MEKNVKADQFMKILHETFSRSKVVPVLITNEIEDAIPLAEALISGGLSVLEVTLRTPNALKIIKEMSKVRHAVVGAGTLLNRNDVENAIHVGAKFGVSPGTTDDLVEACQENGLPLLAGVSSVSEVMKMVEKGYNLLKFFPADAAGGISTLKAFNGPLPHVSFCPTGGVTLENFTDYLALNNVSCVGGSWVATPDMIQQKAWDEITKQADFASRVGR